jgi:hypothetical protein
MAINPIHEKATFLPNVCVVTGNFTSLCPCSIWITNTLFNRHEEHKASTSDEWRDDDRKEGLKNRAEFSAKK